MQMFSCKIWEIFKKPHFVEHLRCLILIKLVFCDILIKALRVTRYKLLSLWVASCELLLLYELRATFCIRMASCCILHKLRVTFYIRVTSYHLLPELRVTFIAWTTSYFLHTNHELILLAQFTSYFMHTSCILGTVYCTSYELLDTAQVMICVLTMSYDEVKYDKDVMIMIST